MSANSCLKVLSEVPTRPIEWLWEGRIPRGKITILDGDPGVGKSALALDLAARVSRGAPMPMSRAGSAPAEVVLFNDDDSLSDTVRPRLEAAGADLSRIWACERRITPADLGTMRPALIIIDPFSTYFCIDCGGQSHDGLPEGHPRHMLKELSDLARQTGAALLAVQDLPNAGEAPWGREIFDAARSVLNITRVGHHERRLVVTKSNLRPLPDHQPLVYQHQQKGHVLHVGGCTDHV
jgi:predicted ATP-dependent serine protease